MSHDHHYSTSLKWTGNLGTGTSAYNAYSRNHEVSVAGKYGPILGSSDPHFRGDKTRYNPEELLVAALSQCHLLSYLHLCAINNIVVTEYTDEAWGTMVTARDGSGKMTDVLLRPVVTVTAESDAALALELHHEAHRLCFIANSVAFPVRHEPQVIRG